MEVGKHDCERIVTNESEMIRRIDRITVVVAVALVAALGVWIKFF